MKFDLVYSVHMIQQLVLPTVYVVAFLQTLKLDTYIRKMRSLLLHTLLDRLKSYQL